MKVNVSIPVFSGVFLLMAFLTWQQIMVIRLGYRVSALQGELVSLEIGKQGLMRRAHSEISYSVLCRRSRAERGMRVPSGNEIGILEIDAEGLIGRKPASRSFLAFFREIFSSSPAQAR